MLKARIKTRKCKCCGEPYQSSDSFRKWCSVECGVKLAKEAQAKARAKMLADKEKSERARIKAVKASLKPRSAWLKELQAVFNKYIRLRDKDLPCISCGRYHQGQWHAGHYRTVGSTPELRFNELNVHKQCSVCNNHLSGNLVEYRLNLIEKIGQENVDFLERKDHPPLKLSEDEIKKLIKVYKAKVKELENGVN